MNRVNRNLGALALAVACGVAGGCNGTDDGRRMGDDAGQIVGEVARSVKVDRTTVNQDGRVRYWIENISGQDQEDLVWSVTFHLPPEVKDGLEVPEQGEVTSERGLVLYKDDKARLVEAECPNWTEIRARGKKILSTTLNLQVQQPVPTIARNATERGTVFDGGRLECVGMDPDDLLGKDSTWIEFENVSSRKLLDLELQYVFAGAAARTKWKSIPALAPGQRARVEVDLRGLGLGTDRDFMVKVRQQAL
jgi:hypothetical protein